MSTLSPFRRQLEAMLLIPAAQAPARPREPESSNAPDTPPTPPPNQTPSPPVSEVAVPTYLRDPAPAWSVAETIEAGSLPIPQEVLPFEPPPHASSVRILCASPAPAPERIPTGTLEGALLPIPKVDVAATSVLAELPIPREVLPFAAGTPGNDPPGDDLRATMALGALPIPVAKLPFESAPPLAIEGMTLDGYAALCAALAGRPAAEHEAVFAAHGLADPDRRRAAGAAWSAHLAAHGDAMSRFRDLYAQRTGRR